MTSRIGTIHWYHPDTVELILGEGTTQLHTKLSVESVVDLVQDANQRVPWLLKDTIIEEVTRNAENYYDEHEEVSVAELRTFLDFLKKVME